MANNPTILLVDDAKTIVSFVPRALRNYSCIIAEDGEQGLELYNANKADIGLVITDIEMPKMNGDELTKLLKQDNPNLTVIAGSGNAADAKILASVRESGADYFFQKPYDIKIIDYVEKALKGEPIEDSLL